MPNRVIKESICTSDTLAQLSAEEERLFYRLIVQADDWGRFDGRAAVVLAACFPLQVHEITANQVEAWLQRLAEVGLIRFYFVDGRRYLYFVTWDKHQQRRAKYSKYPHPPAGDGGMQASASDCNHMPAIVPEKRESRIETRETRQTDETRACAHVQAAAGESAQVRESSVSPPVGLPFSESDEPPNELAAIARHYGDRIGILSPGLFEALGEWVTHHGMEPAVIMAAIDLTAEAKSQGRIKRGTIDSYLLGVIRQMHNDGTRTMADLEARSRARADPAGIRGIPNASAYQPVDAEAVKRWKEMFADEYDQAGVGR